MTFSVYSRGDSKSPREYTEKESLVIIQSRSYPVSYSFFRKYFLATFQKTDHKHEKHSFLVLQDLYQEDT
jgi:hypothetical protein